MASPPDRNASTRRPVETGDGEDYGSGVSSAVTESSDSMRDEFPSYRPGSGPDPLDEAIRRRIRDSGVRIDKVEAVSRKIAAGEYKVDPAAVADSILRAFRDA